MISKISEKIADWLISENDEAGDREVLIYGSELFFSNLLSFIITIISGIVFGLNKSFMIMLSHLSVGIAMMAAIHINK